MSQSVWNDDSLILEKNVVVKCLFFSVIPIFYNLNWYFFSSLWPTNQYGSFEGLHDRVFFVFN